MEHVAEARRLRALHLPTLPRIAAGAAAAVACCVLAGWLTGARILVTFVPGRPGMVPLAALVLLVAAAGAWLATERGAAAAWASRVAGAVVALLAAAALWEYALDVDLGLGRLLPAVELPLIGPGSRSRPSPPMAVALLLLGLSLLLLDVEGHRGGRPSELLAAAAGFLGIVELTAYAYGASHGPSVPAMPRAAMSIPAALGIALVSAALLGARPERGAMALVRGRDAGGFAARRLLPVAILGPPVLGLLANLAHRMGWRDPAQAEALLAALAVPLAAGLVLTMARALDRAGRDQARLASLVATTDDIVEAISPGGIVESWNPAAERLFDWSAAEMRGSSILRIVPPERVPELQGVLAAIARGERVSSFDTERVARDGTRIPVRLTMSAIRDAAGQLSGVSAIGRDIRGRKAAEAALRHAHESERRLREQLEAVGRACEAASEAVASMPQAELREVLQTIVREAQRVTGAAFGALGIEAEPGQPFEPWVFGGVSPEEAARIGRFPRPVGLLGAVAHDGAVVRVADLQADPRFRGFPPHHPDMRRFLGVPLRYRGRSIGNLYLANGQGAPEFTADDERVVALLASRVGPILEAAQLYRQREEWTSVIAHDLRQPLGVIRLAASTLPRLHGPALPPGEAKAIERIRSAAVGLGRMIDDLLDASRIEARRLKLERRLVGLGALVRELVERREADSDHPVQLEVRGACVEVLADPDRIEQVLGNLLANAAKYGTPGTEIRVVVEGREGAVAVSVSNRGAGLAPEQLARVFERHYRTPSAERCAKEGLGLGLYIVRGLVEAHGGHVEAQSVPGDVTTFRFVLPASPPPGPTPPIAGP